MEPDLTAVSGTKLYRMRQQVLSDLGKLDAELNERRSARRRHVKQSDLVWTQPEDMSAEQAERLASRGISHCQVISPELGFDIYNMHMFLLELAPHSEGGAYHRHGDAIKYYLSGRAVELVGDERFEVEAGDFMHIPANTWHGTQNPYDEPVRMLAVQQFPGTYVQTPAPFLDRG